jgi:hypothetical protein
MDDDHQRNPDSIDKLIVFVPEKSESLSTMVKTAFWNRSYRRALSWVSQLFIVRFERDLGHVVDNR